MCSEYTQCPALYVLFCCTLFAHMRVIVLLVSADGLIRNFLLPTLTHTIYTYDLIGPAPIWTSTEQAHGGRGQHGNQPEHRGNIT